MIAVNQPDSHPKELGDMSPEELIAQHHEFTKLAHLADSPVSPKASRSFASALQEIADAYLQKTGRRIDDDIN